MSYKRRGTGLDSIWCGFGAALVSIRIQFGLGLDLNWVITSVLILIGDPVLRL